jgi:hypothetical protein
MPQQCYGPDPFTRWGSFNAHDHIPSSESLGLTLREVEYAAQNRGTDRPRWLTQQQDL